MNDLICKSLDEARDILDKFITPHNVGQISMAAAVICSAFRTGGKVIACGNGGSLCDAAHFAEEFTGRFRRNRKPYPALAINDPAYITCVGNDFSFDEIFSRYVEAMGMAGDVLLAISTSGNSPNVVRAAEAAKALGMKVISLTREGDNRLSRLSDITLASPGAEFSDRIQEIHIKIIHILIQAIESALGEG